jgi:hypothetical protein
MYGVKSILQVYIHALEIVNVEGRATAQRERVERPSFRAFGDASVIGLLLFTSTHHGLNSL